VGGIAEDHAGEEPIALRGNELQQQGADVCVHPHYDSPVNVPAVEEGHLDFLPSIWKDHVRSVEGVQQSWDFPLGQQNIPKG